MFKRNLTTCVFMMSLLSGFSSAKDYVMAFSPYQSPEQTKEQVISALQFATALEQGDQVMFFDGYNLDLIGTFKNPDNPAYNSAKARLSVNGEAVSALMQFATAARQPRGEGEPSHSHSIRLPQLLRTVATNSASDDKLDLIVLGSPLYDDPNEPAYAMTDGRYPSDGHLSHGRQVTLFGATDSPALFQNLRVHIGYGNNGIFANDRHQHAVERFYTLFIEAQGGQLISFSGDRPIVLDRVKQQVDAPPRGYTREDSDKLEMIRLREVEIIQSIYNRPISATPLSAAQVQRAENIEVGISWDCQRCDLDLYALAYPNADLIYFGNTSTPLGELWKDHTTSPSSSKGFETIAFTQPLDIRALRLAINFFGGHAPEGVRGELRLAIDDETYNLPFHIQETNGNTSSQSVRAYFESGTPLSNHTLPIDPLAVIFARR